MPSRCACTTRCCSCCSTSRRHPSSSAVRSCMHRAARGSTRDLGVPGTDLRPLFETILDTIPAPTGDPTGAFQMLISTLDYSSYLGRIGIGRIERGRARVGERVALLPLGEPGLVF